MRIAITGPQGSGKTTLLKELEIACKEQGIDLTPLQEVTRTVKELGFPINESGADETQLMILATHIQNVLAKDNYIVDRCILDGYIYTEWLVRHSKVSSYIAEFAYQLLKRYFDKYDAVFYIDNEFDLEDDGVRSVDAEFSKDIATLFRHTIDRLKSAGCAKNVCQLTGSVETRASTAMEVIKLLREKE